MSSNISLQKAVIHTLAYFGQFTYAPSAREIHLFLPVLSSIDDVERSIQTGIKTNKIIEISFPSNVYRYTLPQYSISKKTILDRLKTSEKKEKMLKKWIYLLKHTPAVQFVGVSGSVASHNALPSDDIDLFIITSTGGLWTARAVLTAFFTLFGIRRQRLQTSAPDKLCMNLWFENSSLGVPKLKQSEYTAYEVWRMRPLVNKNHTYEQFLLANRWTTHYLPNTQAVLPTPHTCTPAFSFFFLEPLMKRVQKYIINRHKTTEFITETQLWFYPDDIYTQIEKNTKRTPIRRN